jgi:hypothetical protein
MAPNIQDTQVCEFHYDSQTLLTSINTKLAGLIWVIGVGITVFALPAIAYVVSLEKRMASAESQIVRIVAQRNADHPAKDKLQ